MKVQAIQQQQNNNIQQKDLPQFKGAGDSFLRYLATNQAVGANGVDLCFMVTPRTASDMIGRGPLAGFETMRREAMGTVNDSLIGVYGMAAGGLAAALMGFKKNYGAKVNNIYAAPETLNILAENKANQLKNGKSQLDYLKETLSNVKAYNPTAKNADKDGYVKLSESTINKAAEIFDKAINETQAQEKKTLFGTRKRPKFDVWTEIKTPNSRNLISNIITQDTGAQVQYILESGDKKISSHTNLETLLNDIFKVSDNFNKEKIQKAFEEQIKSGKSVQENAYIKSLTKFMKTKALGGFLIGSAVGLSVQPINMYISKLKTGSDGFVGVEGRSKDKSAGFFGLKCLSSAAFFGMVLATLGTGLRGFMDKMAFKGFWPTISQLKGVYGLTIISRLMSARDKDELRESLTKDTLGFLSWLVLGDFVNKCTANGLNKEVLNFRQADKDKKGIKRIFNATLKTRDEVLIETLAKNNISTIKEEGGKTVAKSFKEMLKDLDKLSPEVKKAARKKLNVLNKAQLAGYLFSGLVLGLGIPNLNIYITNKLDKKRKAKAAAQKQAAIAS